MVELKITLDDSGRVLTTGSAIEDQIIAYGMIEVARNAIRRHHEAKATSALISASTSDLLALGAPNGTPN
jgi:hypothetical protein